MQGMFVGFYTAQISLIIYEIVPTEVSGSFGAFSQLFVNVGVFVSFLIQFLITEFNSQVDLWRVLFAFMALPILIQTVLLIFVFNF